MIRDKESIQILEKLREDSRRSVIDISRCTNNSRTLVFRKIKFMNKHFIKKYTSIIDFKRLDYNLRVRFLIKSKNKKLLQFLSKNKNINSVLIVKGNFNFYVEAYFKNLSEFNEFDEKLKKLCQEKREHFGVEEIKEESFINGKY
ncbi:MAG: Lrp/AsnC family transcriptional regulator [Nanoarchaeota archaeon]|nr:Lrp/AsnC family transcriptional regulator [Nanoarchaeota archaeon]